MFGTERLLPIMEVDIRVGFIEFLSIGPSRQLLKKKLYLKIACEVCYLTRFNYRKRGQRFIALVAEDLHALY